MIDIGPVGEYLREYDIISSNQFDIEKIHSGVRDNVGIDVLKCRKTGVIFLDRIDKKKEAYPNRGAAHRAALSEDNRRRAQRLLPFVRGGRYADIGCGSGGLLEALKPVCAEMTAVDPLLEWDKNFPTDSVFKRTDDLENDSYDVISLMHVLEHMEDPIEELRLVNNKLKTNGVLFIEVPHARDFLIDFVECSAFHHFTFWSEHLVLHTRESLRQVCKKAGFNDIQIVSEQRYPLSNTLYWLAKSMPRGHELWNSLNDEDLKKAWKSVLSRLDMTDTLWAEVRKL